MFLPLLFSISGFLNGISFFFLGLATLLNNPKKKINQIYFLFSFSVAFWAISYGIWNLPQTLSSKESALFWTRMLNFGALFIPIFFAHWVFLFLGIEKEKKNKIILTLGYLFTLFLALFAFPLSPFTHYFVRDVEPELFFPYWPKPGILYNFYLLFNWVVLLSYVFYCLFKAYKKSSGPQKIQLRYILIGSILGFSGGATNYFLWYDFLPQIAPWGNPLVLTWAIIFPYIVLRYRFMDLRWVLGRTGIYFLSFSSVLLYILILFFFNQKLENPIPNLFLNVFTSLTSILLFLHFFRFFEKIAGRYFYYTFYTLQTTLSELPKKFSQIVELEKLTNLISQSLMDALKLEKVGIVIKEKEEFLPQKLINFKKEKIIDLFNKEKDFLIEYLEKGKGEPLVREEIPFFIERIEDEKEKTNLNLLKEEMEKNKIALFLPLFLQKELIGIILFGDKISRDPYTVQEINLLTNLSSQVSIALSNALSYSKLEKAKEELEKAYNQVLIEKDKFERLYKATLGREMRIIELKEEVRSLKEEIEKLKGKNRELNNTF